MSRTEGHQNRFLERIERTLAQAKPVDPTDVYSDATPADDELVAQAVRRHAALVRARGGRVDLAALTAMIPWIDESSEALSAAIEETLESASAMGDTLDSAALALLDSHPRHAARVRRAVLEQEGARTAPPDQTSHARHVLALPTAYGQKGEDGTPRYELRQVVGVGGQGVVYAAVDRRFSDAHTPQFVAVKVFHHKADPGGTRGGPRQEDGEAMRARRIAHTGVVRPLDRGVDERDHPFVVFELVEGDALDKWRERQAELSTRACVEMMLEIAESVAAAHAAGVVHRDLKPSNILIDRSGRARLTDFGIGRQVGYPLDTRGEYSSRGSLAFMSPEQYLGMPERDAPSVDVYGLAGMLHWFLSSRYPNGQDVREAMRWLELGMEPDREYPTSVPMDLRLICTRGLSRDPSNRHASAASFGDDLRAWLEHRPVAWIGASGPRRAAMFARRSPVAAGMGVAAVLAVMIGTGSSAAIYQHSVQEAKIQQQAIAAQELQAQLDLERERTLEEQRRIKQSRETIQSWARALQTGMGGEPERHLTLLSMLRSLEVTDPKIDAELLAGSVDLAVQNALEMAVDHPGTLECAQWQIVAGHMLIESGDAARGRQFLARAEQQLVALVGESDPLVIKLRDLLSKPGADAARSR